MERLAVDIREAAAMLSVSPRTIRRQIERGRISVVRVGARIVIPLEALRLLLRERFR